jgi:hypothetical protein
VHISIAQSPLPPGPSGATSSIPLPQDVAPGGVPAQAVPVEFPAGETAGPEPGLHDGIDHWGWRKGDVLIVPFGALRLDGLFAEAATTPRAFPMYLERNFAGNDHQLTMSAQATELGLAVFGPPVGTFQTGGRVLVDFQGESVVLNRTNLFLMEAFGELRNDDWRIAFGQMESLISPLNPIMVDFLHTYSAGNLGGHRPQVRVEHYERPSEEVQWTFQAGLSQPDPNEFIASPAVRGRDNGWPNVEGRIALALGVEQEMVRPFELGFSGFVGQARAATIDGETLPFTANTWAFDVDFRLESKWVGLRAEYYVGRGAGTYSGAISQTLNPFTAEAILSTGGWVQVWYRLTPSLLCSVGYGIDDPRNADLANFQRSRNQVVFGNLIWDITRHFQCGVEVSYRETDFVIPCERNNGMVYHFMSRFIF